MAINVEDDFEEMEFRSMKTFEQQRYMKMIEELDNCFRDIENKLKNDRIFLDADYEYDPYKEQFDDFMEHWNYKISSWEIRHPDKKTLVMRLKRELERHSKNFKEDSNALADKNETT